MSYLRLLTPQLDQEASMKRSKAQQQADLFSSVPAPPKLAAFQNRRDEVIELVGRLLWEVVQGSAAVANKEKTHEQDKR